ncbi:MAG: choice-of-anchor D domain-containing protein [Candidatus Omnitrophica bacterium]|nr:choice-of-anchor D domain-containing protein [Candidatus Omnitrophota bacterium]MCA9442827.1 choice-of-anchor D domain-containing protein [Candidatus Omnitrophota bacterium]
MKNFPRTFMLVGLLVFHTETAAHAIGFDIIESLPIDSVGFSNIESATDLDGDGNLDIVLSSGFTGTSFRIAERVAGAWVTRETLAEGNFERTEVGDVDGDGVPEIISSPDRSTVRIREASGDDNYPIIYQHTYGTFLENFKVGDSNGNGSKEFLIGQETSSGRVHILERAGNNAYNDLGFVIGTYRNVFVVGTGDLDSDGLSDLVFSNHLAPAVNSVIYENLATSSTVSGFTVRELGDTDGNGKVEMIGVTSPAPWSGDFRIFESDGDNSFQEVYSATGGHPSIGDLDGDGQDEIFRTILDATGNGTIIQVSSRIGSTVFEIANSGAAFQTTSGNITSVYPMGDTNGDGTPELAVLQGETLHIVGVLVPIISASPSTLVFPDQDIDSGATTPLIVTIRNDGGADLLFTGAGINLTGSDAGEFLITNSPSTAPLPPGATREVSIAFDPSSVGVKSASLTITTNDPDDATTEISISGTGILFTPTPTPTPTDTPTPTPTPTDTPTPTHTPIPIPTATFTELPLGVENWRFYN